MLTASHAIDHNLNHCHFPHSMGTCKCKLGIRICIVPQTITYNKYTRQHKTKHTRGSAYVTGSLCSWTFPGLNYFSAEEQHSTLPHPALQVIQAAKLPKHSLLDFHCQTFFLDLDFM